LTTPATPEYSVVVPVYNEVDNAEPLVSAIALAMNQLGKPWELLVVDDCSTDGSLAALQGLRAKYPQLRLLQHLRNCGQSAAVASGFAAAHGEWVITLDADLQNPPADIPVLLAALTPGVTCVNGVRQKRQDSWVKLKSSKLANGFRNWVTGDTIKDAGCGFRVMRRAALAEIPVFNGMHRFLPTLLRAQGFTVVETPVAHAARVAGVSKYGIHNRLWRGLKDCLAIRWYRQRAVPAQRSREV
jgi:dolichol-phosphate mannosyltransferase